jgi:tetratricopeptide (TPR) repeat protein
METPEVNELWASTSYLISHARSLEAMGQTSEARQDWLSAAQQAERLAELLQRNGVPSEAAQQLVSAASCYGKAGMTARAVALLEKVLAEPETPIAWRQEAEQLLPLYRQREAQEVARLPYPAEPPRRVAVILGR